MANNKATLEKELDLISGHLVIVKSAGYGEVTARVADGILVYIKHTVGEEIKVGKQVKTK